MSDIRCSIVTTLYKGERYLDRFLQDVTEQSIFPELELILVHNTPSSRELEIINKWKPQCFIKHVVTDKLETWGASINRAVRSSSSNLIALWNVDDLRTPESLERQLDAIEEEDVGGVYGDFVISRKFGVKNGQYVNHANYEGEQTRGMVLTPFFMWKKEVHEHIGYMDEQFKSAADFCFAVRLCAHAKVKHVPQILGYYLNEGQGLSTRQNTTQPVERTVIELRYGIIDKIEKQWLTQAFDYNIRHLLQNGEWIKVSSLLPNYESFLKNNEK